MAGMSERTRDLPRRSCHAVPGSNPRFIEKAADLTAESAMLVHDNARRWRVFHARVEALVATAESDDPFLSEITRSQVSTMTMPPLSERPGTRIGPYKLLQQIGGGSSCKSGCGGSGQFQADGQHAATAQ